MTSKSKEQFSHFNQFKKVDRIEPKRTFIISQLMKTNKGNRRYLHKLSRDELEDRLENAREITLQLSEQELDEKIRKDSPRYKKRLRLYNSVDWYLGIVDVDEVGVWRRAGGLPIEWTQGSLADTGALVKKALRESENNKIVARARRSIPRILEHVDLIGSEKYLLPIVLPGATNGRGLNGRPYKNFKKMKGDIDDGCMRSVALFINGKSSFNAYIGLI